MGRREDLERSIRESYALLREYEEIVRLTSDPRERARGQQATAEQWDLIKGYLDEYLPLCERLQVGAPADIVEIVARFPDYADRLDALVLRQAGAGLQAVMRAEGLAEPEQAARTIATALPTGRALMFQSGLCAGYPLIPAPQQYFVVQEFSADRQDLLHALEAAFGAFNLRPYRADQDIEPGHILCKIAAKIQTTLFSVFELTRAQNRNVSLELGIALGRRRPFVLVKEPGAGVTPLTEGLDFYTIRSYAGLRRELGQRVQQYLLNIARYQAPALPPAGSSPTYILAHGDHDMPPDFCVAVAEALAVYGLTPVLLGDDNHEVAEVLDHAGIAFQTIDGAGATRLDAATEAIQAARFGIYRVDATCAPDAFLALGLALGLDRPWLIASREGAPLPSDVRGLSGLTFRSFGDLERQFKRRFGDFLKRYSS